MKSLRFTILLGGLLLIFNAGSALLAASSTTDSISASPAEIQLEVGKAKIEQSSEITLTNNYDSTLVMAAELRDIDESSALLLPAGPLDEQLAKSLNISETSFTIAPHSQKKLKISGRNTDSLSPGGHYASLLVSQQLSNGQQVGLRSALSINVFLIKTDGIKQSVKLDKIDYTNWLFHIVSRAKVKLTNEGNVRTTPHGVMSVTDRHGNLISKGIINQKSQPVMPSKSLETSLELTRIHRVFYPQKLYVNISYRADDQPATVQTHSFWYVPPIYLLLPLALGILFIHILRKRLAKRSKKSSKKTENIPKILRIAIRFPDDDSTIVKVKRKHR